LIAGALLMLAQGTPAIALPVARICGATDEKEIVVCGSRDERSPYRLPEISTAYERPPLRAQTVLAPGVQAGIDLQSVELPGGLKSERLMVTLRTRF
jgi:hypothetical protein